MDAVLGFALVFITGYYAWQTRRLVVEMQQDRAAEKQARRQVRSEDAAYRALLALRPASRLGGEVLMTRSACEDLHAVLDSELGLLADLALRDRVRAASLVAFTAAFPGRSSAITIGSWRCSTPACFSRRPATPLSAT